LTGYVNDYDDDYRTMCDGDWSDQNAGVGVYVFYTYNLPKNSQIMLHFCVNLKHANLYRKKINYIACND